MRTLSKIEKVAGRSEAGLTLLELLVVCTITSVILGAMTLSVGRILSDTGQVNDNLTARVSSENAAYWIWRDAIMADSVTTTELIAPDFMVIRWTQWSYDSDSIYHTVTYSIENVTNGVGELKRQHLTSTGEDRTIRVASNIYYNPSDTSGTSAASFDGDTLILKIVGKFGSTAAVKEIKAYPRPNFYAH